jgi:hypothetical protein
MRGGEPQLGPAMADSGLPVETPPPPLGDTTDESAPGLPTPVRMIRGPSPKAWRIVTSGCSTWNEPVNQLKASNGSSTWNNLKS